MKAWRLHKPAPIEEHPLRLEEIAMPIPREAEILIRVLVCGLCRTDLHIAEGDIELPLLPITPGHQVIGRVEQVGKNVRTFKLGDRVGVPWLHQTCGLCSFCLSDRENLCDHGKFTGQHAHGGYAEYMTAPADFAYSIPDSFDDLHAAPLLCSGVIGYRALKIADAHAGGKLGIYGFGSSAHITMQIALSRGIECFVITRGDAGQQHARRLGAAWTGNPEDTPPVKLDRVVIFAPAGELVPQSLTHLKKGGIITCAGIHMTDIPQFPYHDLWGERVIRSVANSTRGDVRELLQIASDLKLTPDVTEFGFDHLNKHLIALKHGKFTGTGVVRVHREI
jgi:alcohol dehydrogenase, propanol-preferring